MNYKIPVYKPNLQGNEKNYVLSCLESNWISSKGFFVTEFEEKFKSYLSIPHATTASNGTVVLHLALLALGIGPGDEVIVPTLTYVASVNAIRYVDATPIFVDSQETTWQINPEEIEKKITKKTKAIMVVHLYGHPCDMDAITTIAKKHNLFIIEDCAEALGTRYKNQLVGTFGDVATFSFYGNKTITTGEGGMIVTPHKSLYELIIRYKGQGLSQNEEYWHDLVGYNYRMTNICAAIGVAQLEKIELFLTQKRKLAHEYMRKLQHLPLVFHQETPQTYHSYWMVSILTNTHQERNDLRNHLATHGIETRPLFKLIHTMPMYNNTQEQFPIASLLSMRGINLPSWPDLTLKEITEICDCIQKFYASTIVQTRSQGLITHE